MNTTRGRQSYSLKIQGQAIVNTPDLGLARDIALTLLHNVKRVVLINNKTKRVLQTYNYGREEK